MSPLIPILVDEVLKGEDSSNKYHSKTFNSELKLGIRSTAANGFMYKKAITHIGLKMS